MALASNVTQASKQDISFHSPYKKHHMSLKEDPSAYDIVKSTFFPDRARSGVHVSGQITIVSDSASFSSSASVNEVSSRIFNPNASSSVSPSHQAASLSYSPLMSARLDIFAILREFNDLYDKSKYNEALEKFNLFSPRLGTINLPNKTLAELCNKAAICYLGQAKIEESLCLLIRGYSYDPSSLEIKSSLAVASGLWAYFEENYSMRVEKYLLARGYYLDWALIILRNNLPCDHFKVLLQKFCEDYINLRSYQTDLAQGSSH